MAKGPYLTPRIRKLIAHIYIENRAIRPTDARNKLLQKMKNEGLDKIFGPNFPGISTVSKELKAIRERDEARLHELKELDKPWNILSLKDHAISPEALSTVLILWFWTRENLDIEFTIREAQWAARLYAVAKNVPINFFSFAIRAYASNEIVAELTGDFTAKMLSLDMMIYQLMTGQEITPEQIEKIFGEEEDEFFAQVTEEELAFMKSIESATGFQQSEIYMNFEDAVHHWKAKHRGGKNNERSHKKKG
jgi:hypothetical protein